ncbi:hypothetical protein B0H17DRAFT_1126948 [Mycena rosella]|uniref:Myb/SANT-like domain-containing protein n=1 Tax=Mycena rosella TaxID=1033263 RepID=A0AAD7GRU1_MYCRO|nr:hypothetical protein B0H17DRAFT_1126948 [Mycena rosella]
MPGFPATRTPVIQPTTCATNKIADFHEADKTNIGFPAMASKWPSTVTLALLRFFLVFLYIPGLGMAPGKGSADWATYPEDLTHLLDFLYKQRSHIGDVGNWDKTVMNEAAAHMASNWPPKKGGPKTANSIATKWKGTRKLYDQILQAKQKAYPGASGWTYSENLGFNVKDDTQDAWSNFVKAHPHFKPFATRGWPHFTTVDPGNCRPRRRALSAIPGTLAAVPG